MTKGAVKKQIHISGYILYERDCASAPGGVEILTGTLEITNLRRNRLKENSGGNISARFRAYRAKSSQSKY